VLAVRGPIEHTRMQAAGGPLAPTSSHGSDNCRHRRARCGPRRAALVPAGPRRRAHGASVRRAFAIGGRCSGRGCFPGEPRRGQQRERGCGHDAQRNRGRASGRRGAGELRRDRTRGRSGRDADRWRGRPPVRLQGLGRGHRRASARRPLRLPRVRGRHRAVWRIQD